MRKFGIFKNKKDDDKWSTLVLLSLITIFFVFRAVVISGHLWLFIICFIIGILSYYLFEYIYEKNIKKPVSLGKVYEKKYPIIIQYTPPRGINPAEAGLLYNCSVETTDLTSMIYQWKFEKLIDIKTFTGENSKREYIKLIKKDDLPLTRPLFESEIFDSIFRMGDVKIIEGPFQLRYALMLEDLEYHGIQKGWLKEQGNGNKKKKDMGIKFGNNQSGSFESGNQELGILVGVFMSLLPFLIMMEAMGVSENYITFSELLWSILVIFGIGLCSVVFYGIKDGGGKLKYTDKGAELASKVIGYSLFIKSCDENKIKLLLKEDPLFIDRTLPYATAFGMETEFLKKISPLKKDWNARYVRGKKVPSWTKFFRIFVKDDENLL